MRTITSYKDITLKELIAVSELKDEDMNSVSTARKLVSIFYGSPDDMTVEDFWTKYWEVTAVLYLKPEVVKVDSFTLDGIEYKAIPAERLTTKEFIDFETLQNDNVFGNFTLLLGLAFTDGNDDGDYTELVRARAKKFETLDAETAQNALSFIFASLLNSAADTLRSLATTAKGEKQREAFKKMAEDLLASAGK